MRLLLVFVLSYLNWIFYFLLEGAVGSLGRWCLW